MRNTKIVCNAFCAAMALLVVPTRMMAQTHFVSDARLSLHNGWQLQSSRSAQIKGAQASSPGFKPSDWHSTSVPSTVVAALVADGTYPDPDYGMNLRKIPGTTYPIGKIFANLPMPKDSPFVCSWWYRTDFTLPADFANHTAWMHFEGINYRANIWINGKQFANAKDIAGSYRTYDFNVTQFVKAGAANAIAVEVFAPTEKDLAMNWVDWNPAPPDKDMGLWGGVYLTASGSIVLLHPEVITHFRDASLDKADLTVVTEVRNSSRAPVNAAIEGAIGEIHFAKSVELAPNETRSVTFAPKDFPQLRILHPKVWWPYGLGSQTLETLSIRVRDGDAISDQQEVRFGIREITSEMLPGDHLLFRVNGKRILIRGGGWAPDMLLRESAHKLQAQFDYVREMGLNTIRLEGKLEPDEFFNLADERGVLVMAGWCCCSFWEQWGKWQPSDLQNATEQLRSQILRLRSHPSLLVWLNGSDMPPPANVERTYLQVEKDLQWPNPVISSASATPTSVSGPSGVKMTGPYDYVPPAYWLEDRQRGGAYSFITETSPGPAPVVEESLRKMMPADQIWPPNQYWHFHAASGHYQTFSAFDSAMDQMYGPPKDLADYERKAQAMTYEGERAMFEAYARNKYDSTGVIQWMLNNAWPSLYWHLYDYYLQTGGGYFGTKKANELLHIQYSYDDRSVVVVNSYYHPFPAVTVSAAVYDFNLKSIFSKRVNANISADASQRVLTLPALPQTEQPQVYFVKLDLTDESGKQISSNFYWLSNKTDVFAWNQSTDQGTKVDSYSDLTKLARLPRVKLEVVVERKWAADGEVTVHLRNTRGNLAFQVMLAIDSRNGHEVLPVFWSDNYIELMPGESKTITAHYPSWIKLEPDAKLEVGGWNIEPETAELFEARAGSANQPVIAATAGR